jgi:hypothetical protein
MGCLMAFRPALDDRMADSASTSAPRKRVSPPITKESPIPVLLPLGLAISTGKSGRPVDVTDTDLRFIIDYCFAFYLYAAEFLRHAKGRGQPECGRRTATAPTQALWRAIPSLD